MKMKKLKRERSACHFLSPLESANTNGKSLSLSSYYSSCTPMLKYPTADLPISWCVSGYNSTKNKKYNFLLPQMGDRPHRQLLSQYFHQTKQFSTNEITLINLHHDRNNGTVGQCLCTVYCDYFRKYQTRTKHYFCDRHTENTESK